MISGISGIKLASHAIYPGFANNIEEAPASAFSSLRFCAFTATLKRGLLQNTRVSKLIASRLDRYQPL